jgi:hypothetical protein
MNGWRRRQVAQDETEGVINSDLIVTVRDDEKDRKVANAPAKEAQQLE